MTISSLHCSTHTFMVYDFPFNSLSGYNVHKDTQIKQFQREMIVTFDHWYRHPLFLPTTHFFLHFVEITPLY